VQKRIEILFGVNILGEPKNNALDKGRGGEGREAEIVHSYQYDCPESCAYARWCHRAMPDGATGPCQMAPRGHARWCHRAMPDGATWPLRNHFRHLVLTIFMTTTTIMIFSKFSHFSQSSSNRGVVLMKSVTDDLFPIHWVTKHFHFKPFLIIVLEVV